MKNDVTNDTQKEDQAPKAGAMVIPVSPFQQNCTLLWCETTKKAVVIDPGGDVPQILAAIKQASVTVDQIWITHGHIDHVGGADELRDALKVQIIGPHLADKFLLDHVEASGAKYGMTGTRNFTPDRWLAEGEKDAAHRKQQQGDAAEQVELVQRNQRHAALLARRLVAKPVGGEGVRELVQSGRQGQSQQRDQRELSIKGYLTHKLFLPATSPPLGGTSPEGEEKLTAECIDRLPSGAIL